MTRDRARKKAIRARMAASGEPYSVAAAAIAAAIAAAGPADDATAVRAIIIRASNTMAAASARIERRVDSQLRVGGQNYGGLPGSPLTARYRQRATGERPEEPLGYRPGRLRRAHGLD